jgi:hypothetical protein
MARCFAREQTQHAAEAPHRFRSLHAMLVQQLPDRDLALIGQHAILTYLGDVLLLRRPNGRQLRWHMVLRWRRDLAFPLLRGGWRAGSRCLSPPLTSTHAVTAWTLAQFDSAKRRAVFSIGTPMGFVPVGKAPKELGTVAIARRYRERRERAA